MKYPSQIPGASDANAAHVVAGILTFEVTGTVRVRAYRLRAGGLAPVQLTLTGNDTPQAVPGKARWFTFDLQAAMEATAAGSFASNFPRWEERAVLVEFYDDAQPDANYDVAKVTFGGGEDQIDFIAGPDRLNLGDIASLVTSGNIWTVLTGFNYNNAGAPANQAAHIIEFTPFLLHGGQQVNDRFLRGATAEIFAVDGSTPIYTMTDAATETTLDGAISDSAVTLQVISTVGISPTDLLAIGDELVEVVTVDSGVQLTVVRGASSTTATAHGSGSAVYRSAADQQGVFHCQRTGTASLTIGENYTLIVSVGYKGLTYRSTHAFIFAENDV